MDFSTYIYISPQCVLFLELCNNNNNSRRASPRGTECRGVLWLHLFVLIGLQVFFPVYEAYGSNRVAFQCTPPPPHPHQLIITERKGGGSWPRPPHPHSHPDPPPRPASSLAKSLCASLLGCNDATQPPCVPGVHLHVLVATGQPPATCGP